jgi:DNA-binding MarR family transcriptional regulator
MSSSFGPGPDSRVSQLYAVLQYVRPLHRHVAQAVADRLVGTGVTVGSRAVLERVGLDGPSTVPQISRVLALPRQFVQRMVNDLSELGLVEFRPNPAHRRSSLIARTPAGVTRLAAVRATEDASLAELAATLTDGEVAAAVRVMEALTCHFRAQVEADHSAGTRAPDQTDLVDADIEPVTREPVTREPVTREADDR